MISRTMQYNQNLAIYSAPLSLISTLLITYFAFVAVWPFYIDIRFSDNVGLNPQRILAILVSFALAIDSLNGGRQIDFIIKHVRVHIGFYFPFIFYFFWRVISAVYAGNNIDIYIVLYEIVTYLLIYFGFLYYVFNAGRHLKWLNVVIITTVILSVICFLEAFLEYNFLAGFATRTERMAISATEILRSGGHRIKGTFEHPLTLVQYVAMILPLVVVATSRIKPSVSRIMWLFILLAILFLTKSRSALVFISVTCLLYLIASNNLGKRKNTLLKYTFIVVLAILFVLSSFALDTIIADWYGKSLLESSARLAQLFNGIIAIGNSPWFGYGPGASIGQIIYEVSLTYNNAMLMWESNAVTVDNRYLSIAMESGVPAFISFVSFNTVIIWKAWLAQREHASIFGKTQQWYWLMASLMSCVGALVTMIILSIFTVHTVYFIVLSLLVHSVDVLRRELYVNCYNTCK